LTDIVTVCVQYKGLNIPYPQDKDKVKEQVDAEEKEAVSRGFYFPVKVLHF